MNPDILVYLFDICVRKSGTAKHAADGGEKKALDYTCCVPTIATASLLEGQGSYRDN